VDIPIDLCAFAELVVNLRADHSAANGRHDPVDEGVEEEGEDGLVGVQGERRKTQRFGVRLDDADQPLGRLNGKWVAHGAGAMGSSCAWRSSPKLVVVMGSTAAASFRTNSLC
jgi:hypothetical protein